MADALRTPPAREDLCRSAPFTLTRATDEGSDGLTIEGYGAVFNSPTRINSWEGDFEEVIAPGAFKRSLKARVPLMQFDHGQHPLLGSLPLGRWTVAEEDERGLHLVGRLTDNWLVTPFRDAIRDGGVKGMSFRFAVVKDDWTDAAGKRLRDDEVADMLYRGPGDRGPILRTLREVRASEAGPVVHPAYEDTVVGVRSRDGKVVIDLGRLHEPVQREQLAKIVALADRGTLNALCDTDSYSQVSRLAQGTTWSGEERQQATVRTLIDAGYTPESVVAHVMQGEPLQHTGKFSVQLQPERSSDPTPVEASPPADVPVGSPNVEQQIEIQPDPQSTAPSPDDHSTRTGDPEVTDHAPGEHSAPTRPVNPVERRELIRKEFRAVTNRVLALPRHQTPKENSA
jgi:HK97 family phage prohead protease